MSSVVCLLIGLPIYLLVLFKRIRQEEQAMATLFNPFHQLKYIDKENRLSIKSILIIGAGLLSLGKP
ncbi:integral membrane protein [Neisseria gonorrhoeae]|uniref:Integral membrane protein n=1 Tax=Neisseria gonorrhoeae TaxID=485 RepID=A0A378VYR5_NEIGO|nr:integral membrane protein [Neisseria gonorrhoeae]